MRVHPAGSPWGSDRERGSGTIWVLTLCTLVWFSTIAVILVVSVRTDRHRAATAADLAALAGAREAAEGRRHACGLARHTASANGARLTHCTLSGLTLDVGVDVPARLWPGRVSARARAGPLGAASAPEPPLPDQAAAHSPPAAPGHPPPGRWATADGAAPKRLPEPHDGLEA
ncbi:Rv3654c family TadE-like protein [Actinorugispora endophytica]|uniref:Secretion/DNA translocation related TadE-like protein n=1 Tax=Actinorugispora endophytica TaxID=1605990 RepID=A0A4R6V892_9ACTN|nr:Rv3654c family TadE-like protein [Actinorugispora endophytica]TDQ55356.1 secretion/DNA translocation related TadE-like protein [Actinorugispora endophytica]